MCLWHNRVIPAPVVGSSSATPNIYEAPVIQEPKVPNVVDNEEEEEQPLNLEYDVPNQENLRRSQRARRPVIPDD
jgi:hypothetical protein